METLTDTSPKKKRYRIEDFYFYISALNEVLLLPELVQHIVLLVHCIRKETGFKEYEKGTPGHVLAAELLLSLGCEKYDGLVCYRLAHMYHYGKGLTQDKKKGQELYANALLLLGSESALELFFKGVIYKEGLAGEVQLKKAVTNYRKSAKMGCPMAQINLGVCYRTGEGVQKDMARACKYFKRAATQESALGQCHIGYMYEFGFGVEKDLKKAVKYYQLAASKKHEYAETRLNEIGKDKIEELLK
jgi:TPR repeat protein